MQSWRFIPFALHSAWLNMAIDEAILEEHLAGTTPPTLRLYGFAPMAVSLGYAQKISPETVANIEARGVSVVRRPTGGRAVLHAHDLTYSFVALAQDGAVSLAEEKIPRLLSSSVQRAYKQISEGLIAALSKFGIQTELGKSSSDYRLVEDCFAQTTQADLHFQGKKLVGSAQLRRRGAVLQHGSIVLQRNDFTLAELLGSKPGRRRNEDAADREAADSLYGIIGRELEISAVNEAFKAGFENVFQHEFAEGQLTASEEKRAKELSEKYREIFPA